MLIGLLVFTFSEFRQRHQWRIPTSGQKGTHWGADIDLGRLFCLWVFRVWVLSLLLMAVFFLGAKYVA